MRKILTLCLDWLAASAGVLAGLALLALLDSLSTFAEPEHTIGFRVATAGVIVSALSIIAGSVLGFISRRASAWANLACIVVIASILAILQSGEPLALGDFAIAFLVSSILPFCLWAYWWMTRRSVPVKFPGKPHSWSRRVFIGVGLLVLLFFSVVTSLCIAARFAAHDVDCNGGVLFARQKDSRQIVLVAHSVAICCRSSLFVGRTIGGFMVAKVDKQYWGLPWWNPGIVFLVGNVLPVEEPIFVDGEQSVGRLARLLSIIRVSCGRTNYLREAKIDLQLLQDGPPQNSGRIIGEVWIDWNGSRPKEKAIGVPVTISGPSGAVNVLTDSRGIYDLRNLPPGAYEIATPGASDENFRQQKCKRVLEIGKISGCKLYVLSP